MPTKSLICLTDADGEVRWFDHGDLNIQIAAVGLSMGGALAAACKNIIQKVRTMRGYQKDFFSANYGSPAKESALRNSKKMEAEVDELLNPFLQIIDKL